MTTLNVSAKFFSSNLFLEIKETATQLFKLPLVLVSNNISKQYLNYNNIEKIFQ